MKKTMQYALLLICLQERIMIAPSFDGEISEPTNEQSTKNTAEEARKQRYQQQAAERTAADTQQQKQRKEHNAQATPTDSLSDSDSEDNLKKTAEKTKKKVHFDLSKKPNAATPKETNPQLSSQTSGWNTVKRWFFSIHDKSYVKEVITQALNGDLNAMTETENFQDRSLNKTLSIKTFSFKNKQDIVATLQNEANKVYRQKIDDLETQKKHAFGDTEKENSIQKLIDVEKQAFQDTVNKLVKSLDPMLIKSTDSQRDRHEKDLEKIITSFDMQTGAVRLELYHENAILNSALFKFIPERVRNNQNPEQNALAKRFNIDIGETNYDDTLNDNINQKYQSLTTQQQKVFLDNLSKLATSKVSTRDILDAAYGDAQTVKTSWFGKSKTNDSATAPSRFKPSDDSKKDPLLAFQYIENVENKLIKGRIDSLNAADQISSAVGYASFEKLRTNKLLPKILDFIQTKENQEYKQTMQNLNKKTLTTTSKTDLQLIMLQKQEATDAFKARCQEIQNTFTEMYRKSLNNITKDPEQITLTFDEENGAAQFTVEPMKIDTKIISTEPKDFPKDLNDTIKNQLLGNAKLLDAFMAKYNILTSDYSKEAFINMLNENAKSTHPHSLTTTLINTTWYIATMPQEFLKTLDSQLKHLLMTNFLVANQLEKQYKLTHKTTN